MISLIVKVVKKVIFAIVLLYGLNLMLTSLDIVIPINLISIIFITIFDIPGLLSLIILYFII